MKVMKGKIYYAFTDREVNRIVEGLEALSRRYVEDAAGRFYDQPDVSKLFFDISCEISELKNRIEATREKVANE